MARALLKRLGMKVMIAEDSDSVRFALRMALEFLGHEVVGLAADGVEALQAFSRTHPQVVLMDVRMPNMDGLTCTARLHDIDPAAKVVVVTAGRTTETQARAAGADGFMEKPFDVSELRRVIERLVPA
jgi:CheY-like chemotaxis protein